MDTKIVETFRGTWKIKGTHRDGLFGRDNLGRIWFREMGSKARNSSWTRIVGPFPVSDDGDDE